LGRIIFHVRQGEMERKEINLKITKNGNEYAIRYMFPCWEQTRGGYESEYWEGYLPKRGQVIEVDHSDEFRSELFIQSCRELGIYIQCITPTTPRQIAEIKLLRRYLEINLLILEVIRGNPDSDSDSPPANFNGFSPLISEEKNHE
jgi:hypothetical protein